jgi:hypothetical protein
MAAPSVRHDAVGGAAVAVWVTGMGLVLGTEEAVWQVPGACLWAVGLAVGCGVAGHTYYTRSRHRD